MIQGQIIPAVAAVLAGMPIAVQQILAGERNLFVRNTHVMTQANHRGEWKPRINELSVMLDLLSFAFDKQDNCSPPTGNIERFVGGIEHQNLSHSD